jgi:hypothetical protein
VNPTNRRYMLPPVAERKIINWIIWAVIGLTLIAFVLSACSPYAAMLPMGDTPTATATAQASPMGELTATPAPYWQLAAQGWQHFSGAIVNAAKIGH